MTKLFVPLIKGSFCPQFYTIFGKLNIWRNIDRRGPYKNGGICTILICAKKIFLAKLFIPLIKGSFCPQFFAIFGKLNFWRNIDRHRPYKNGEYLNYLKLCKEIIFWQNYLSHSSKEVFLHNFSRFLENWIFEGISTGADLTKMVNICTILICAKKIFFGKIICSTHQRKSFSTIFRDFWKIEFWRNIDRRGPYKNGENLYYLNLC